MAASAISMIVTLSLPFRRCGIVSTLDDFVRLFNGTFHYQLADLRAIPLLNLFFADYKLQPEIKIVERSIFRRK